MKVIKIALKAGVIVGMVGSSSVFAQNLADAKKAIDAEQFEKAKTMLKGLVASQPANAENYYYLGKLYLNDEYIDSAKTVFNKGIAADPKEALNYVGLGSVDLATKNAAAAKANFDKALSFVTKRDNDPYIYVAKAYITAPQPNFADAQALLERAKASDSKDAEVYLALGDLYGAQSKYSDAYGAYRSAFDLDKNLLRAKVELGMLTRKSKAFKESADEFNAILATNPNYAPAYRELAETYKLWSFSVPAEEKKAKLDQMLTYYKKYLDLTDRSIESRMRYADYLVYASDWKTLEQEAQVMSKNAETNPRIYRYLAISAFENGNIEDSKKAMNVFMSKVEPERLRSFDYLYLGKAQVKTGDTTGFSNLAKAIDLDSTYAEEMSTWAAAAFKEKKYDEAAKLYELAVQGPKATLNDRFYIGMSHYWDYATKLNEKKNPERAVLVKADSAFAYVNKYAPTVADAYLYRARVNRLLDDDKNPKGLMVPHYEQFIKVLNEKPENLTDARYKKTLAEAYNNLAGYYITSSPSKAKDYASKTLAIDSSNSYASDVLKQLGGGK